MVSNGYLNSPAKGPVIVNPDYAISLGRVAGYTKIICFGHTPTATANTDVWEGGGLYPLQNAASLLQISSASAADTAAGTGARTFLIDGLDANFNPLSEIITMNGVTPVVTVNSYMRVNFVTLQTAGTGGTNAGVVTLQLNGAGAIQAVIRATYGVARSAVYTVPAGQSLIIVGFVFQVGGTTVTNEVNFGVTQIDPNGKSICATEFIAGPIAAMQRKLDIGTRISEKTCVILRVKSVAGVVDGFAQFEGFTVTNNLTI